MTNDIKGIKYNIAGLGLGSLFYYNDDRKIIEIKQDNLYHGDDYIYDTSTGNFHFLPQITEDNAKMWREYLNKTGELKKELGNRLNDRLKTADNSVFNDGSWNDIKLKGIPANKRGGFIKKSILKNYPSEFNHFFRYLCIGSKETGYYTINFIRWFIDKEKNVNCRMGEIQFDYTNNKYVNKICKDESNNEVHVINYPTSYKGQDLNKITINEMTSSCIYNPPGLGNIWNLDEGKIVESFEEFINYVYHLRKEQQKNADTN